MDQTITVCITKQRKYLLQKPNSLLNPETNHCWHLNYFYPRMSLKFAQDINLFALTVKRPKKQHRQWLLLRAVDRQCGLGGFSSLVGHCVPSFLVPNEKDHQWKWLLTLPALADGHESIFNKPPFGPVLQPLCNVKSLYGSIRCSYILCGMGIRLLNLLQYEVITVLWSEQLCDGN